MKFLPIVTWELRVRARRPWTHWSRLLLGFGAVLLAVMILGMRLIGETMGQPMGRFGGGELFVVLSGAAFLLCLTAGIFFTADALSEEKRDGTLGLLFLTDLRGVDVVLGKLAATSVPVIYGLLAMFPAFALTIVMGGVSSGELVRMLAGLCATLLLSLSAGLFVSSLSRNRGRAMGGVGMILILLAVVAPCVDALIRASGYSGPTPFSWVSPMSLFLGAFDTGYRSGAGPYSEALAGLFLLAVTFLGLAALALPRSWQDVVVRTRPGFVPRTSAPAAASTPAAGPGPMSSPLRSPPAVKRLGDGDPVYWLASRGAPRAFTLIMVALIVVSGLVVVRGEVGDFGPAVGGVLSWLLGIVLRVSLSMQSARLFSELRESGGLELMLTTPLRVGEILSGFWRHLRRKYLALVIGICVLQVVIAFASRKAGGGVQEMFWVWWVWWIWFVLYPVATLLGDCFAAGWVGMYLGLTVRRPGMAAGWAVLYGVILPTILMCIPRLLLTIPAAFWARDRLCNQLRALGAPR